MYSAAIHLLAGSRLNRSVDTPSPMTRDRDLKGGLGAKLEPPSNGEYYAALGHDQTNVPRERGMSGNVQRCKFAVQYRSAT
jgi:hypothetical protein